MTAIGTALDVLLLATCWAHVILAPHTKVEESFNLHATHDVLMYGLSSENLQNVSRSQLSASFSTNWLFSMTTLRSRVQSRGH